MFEVLLTRRSLVEVGDVLELLLTIGIHVEHEIFGLDLRPAELFFGKGEGLIPVFIFHVPVGLAQGQIFEHMGIDALQLVDGLGDNIRR